VVLGVIDPWSSSTCVVRLLGFRELINLMYIDKHLR